jgi:hypothetical protein
MALALPCPASKIGTYASDTMHTIQAWSIAAISYTPSSMVFMEYQGEVYDTMVMLFYLFIYYYYYYYHHHLVK